MITTQIADGRGGGTLAQVDKDGNINVIAQPYPPKEAKQKLVPYSQFMTANGTSAGSNDLIVNGATTPVNFWVGNVAYFDLYINRVSIQISDPGASLEKFGAITALTNGVQLFYSSNETGEVIISDAWKANIDVFRDATSGKEFGVSNSAWLVDIAGGGGLDTYFPVIDLDDAFGIPYGVRISKDSKDRLGVRIRDNLAGLSIFNVKVYGFIF